MTRHPHNPPAFSLIELILALGLLAIGMAMVASVFPVAALQSKQANSETMATLIGQNARTIIKARLTHNLGLDATFEPIGVGDPNMDADDLLHGYDCTYPVGTDDPNYDYSYEKHRRGWLALGRQPDPGVNDYQFFIIPYDKPLARGIDYDGPGGEDPDVVTLRNVRAVVAVDGTKIIANFQSDPNDVAIGSPVIDKNTGQYAFIIDELEAVDSNQRSGVATLSDSLGVADGDARNVDLWLLRGTPGRGEPSAAIGCYPFRTALRPN